MTESEAAEKLEAHIECESKRSKIEGCNDGCTDCELAYLQGTSKEHIESLKIAVHALEKQIPKKPLYIANLGCTALWLCPVCERRIIRSDLVYCHQCGQKLDWSDEE